MKKIRQRSIALFAQEPGSDPVDTPLASLQFAVEFSAAGLVQGGAARIGGSGANRVLNFAPLSGKSGTAAVVIRATDGEQSVTSTFQLTILPPNQPPSIQWITPDNRGGEAAAPPVEIRIDPPLGRVAVLADGEDADVGLMRRYLFELPVGRLEKLVRTRSFNWIESNWHRRRTLRRPVS